MLYYELRARKKKGNRNFGNALIKSWIILIYLLQWLIFEDFCCYVCLKCYWRPLRPSISLSWTIIDPEFPLVMWMSFRVKWTRMGQKCAAVFVSFNCIYMHVAMRTLWKAHSFKNHNIGILGLLLFFLH